MKDQFISKVDEMLTKLNFVKTENNLCARRAEQLLRPLSCVYVAVEDTLRVAEDGARVVCKDYLCFSAALTNESLVIFNVINAGKGMLLISEKLAILRER